MDKIVAPKRIFVFHDAAVGQFMNMFLATSNAEAMRGFSDEAKNPQSAMAKHPSDFTLWTIGEIDMLSGSVDLLEKPVLLATASDYIEVS